MRDTNENYIMKKMSVSCLNILLIVIAIVFSLFASANCAEGAIYLYTEKFTLNLVVSYLLIALIVVYSIYIFVTYKKDDHYKFKLISHIVILSLCGFSILTFVLSALILDGFKGYNLYCYCFIGYFALSFILNLFSLLWLRYHKKKMEEDDNSNSIFN